MEPRGKGRAAGVDVLPPDVCCFAVAAFVERVVGATGAATRT
jgi:hypothetical protein